MASRGEAVSLRLAGNPRSHTAKVPLLRSEPYISQSHVNQCLSNAFLSTLAGSSWMLFWSFSEQPERNVCSGNNVRKRINLCIDLGSALFPLNPTDLMPSCLGLFIAMHQLDSLDRPTVPEKRRESPLYWDLTLVFNWKVVVKPRGLLCKPTIFIQRPRKQQRPKGSRKRPKESKKDEMWRWLGWMGGSKNHKTKLCLCPVWNQMAALN